MTENNSFPHIETIDGNATLVVGGNPFLMRAGETHNSTGSSIPWMAKAWDKADELGMNTLLVAVTWELVEPAEGTFDFTGVDALIDQARERGGHLGFLWFGAWKNGQCMYAPEWVRSDPDRFLRAEAVKGERKTTLTNFYNMPYSTLSAFCEETLTADSNAFARLMAHLREYDGGTGTVVLVQVENECGLMGAARDHCDEADRLFAEQVPAGLVAFMREHADGLAADVAAALAAGAAEGTWEEVFGPVAEEMFQTYYTAAYVDAVASAGKDEYPIPMAVNCWLDKGHEPGRFPTGGPNARVLEIWKWAAPSLDACGPDIYVRTFCDDCDNYRKLGNPLFIPETATHAYAAPRAIWTTGHHHALCFSPFGFEEMGEPFDDSVGVLFGMDTSDPALRTPQNVDEYRAAMEGLAGLFSYAGGYGNMEAVISERGKKQTLELGNWVLDVTFGDTPGAVLALPVSDDEAFVLGMGASFFWHSSVEGKPHCDLLVCEDGRFVDSAWMRDRRLNGDETTMPAFEGPTLLRLKTFCYA